MLATLITSDCRPVNPDQCHTCGKIIGQHLCGMINEPRTAIGLSRATGFMRTGYPDIQTEVCYICDECCGKIRTIGGR